MSVDKPKKKLKFQNSKMFPSESPKLMLDFLLKALTRDHGGCEGRHLVEIDPTGLPELSKPSRASENLRKTKILETTFF